MFSFFSNKLTQFSNNYIDWSRTADLLRSNKYHYRTEELLTRGAMIITTAVSGFLGAAYNDPEKTHCSNLTAAIAAGTLGLVASHCYVVAPLFYKRYQFSKACDALIHDIQNINQQTKLLPTTELDVLIQTILKISLASGARANASQTWGFRTKLLERLKGYMENGETNIVNSMRDTISREIELFQSSQKTNAPETNRMKHT